MHVRLDNEMHNSVDVQIFAFKPKSHKKTILMVHSGTAC